MLDSPPTLQHHALLSVLLERLFRRFGQTSRRVPGELIREVIPTNLPPTWQKLQGGQMKTWSGTIKENLALGGPWVHALRRWNWEWVFCDRPGLPSLVYSLEGCHQRTCGQPLQTRMVAPSVRREVPLVHRGIHHRGAVQQPFVSEQCLRVTRSVSD